MTAVPVHEALARAAAERPESVAVRDETGAWTYRELVDQSELVAGNLRARGIGRGDRVVAILTNSRVAVALLYGVLRRGAVYVPLGSDLHPYLRDALVQDADPALVIADEAVPNTPALAPSQLFVPPGGAPVPRDDDREQIAPTDTALLLYTSGSTSFPKAVVCPHRQVAFVVDAIAQRVGYRSDDVVYVRSPFSFDYGLYQVFLCATARCELALTGGQPEATALRFVHEYGATVLPLIPSQVGVLLRLAARTSTSPPPLRLITSTGADLPPVTATALRAGFPGTRVMAMYGMTECKRITIAEADSDLQHPGTVGTALPGTAITVIDEGGTPVPPGTVGQIVVSGPHVMTGYWRAPQATAERYRSGPNGEPCLYTGDFGSIDGAGRLTLIGRRDDIFKRRGVRTGTAEIEAAALDVPGVSEAAVRPPGPTGVLRIWVVAELTGAEVLRALAQRLPPAKVPDRCTVLERLPRNGTGKIAKLRLEAEGTRN